MDLYFLSHRRLALFAILLCLYGKEKAFAQKEVELHVPAQALTMQEDQTRHHLMRKTCQARIRNHPSAGAAYRPGIDNRGNFVMPADLMAETPDRLADRAAKLEMPLQINPFEAKKIPAPAAGFISPLQLGRLSLRGQEVFLDGQSLTKHPDDAAITACRQEFPDL